MRAVLELLDACGRERRLSHPLRTLHCGTRRDCARWRRRRRERGFLMARSSHTGWYILGFLALSVLALDQASKFAVEKYTAVGSLRVLVPGVLNLVHASNPGVAFGLLADSPTPW